MLNYVFCQFKPINRMLKIVRFGNVRFDPQDLSLFCEKRKIT